jgi:hypothetical protein
VLTSVLAISASTTLVLGLMSASHRRTIAIDATGTIAELADIPKRVYAVRLGRGLIAELWGR